MSLRRFTSSGKFWEISANGSRTTLRYGSLSSKGRTLKKDHATAAEATKYMESHIRSKVRKEGYIEVSAAPPAISEGMGKAQRKRCVAESDTAAKCSGVQEPCASCGFRLSVGDNFCSQCGAKVRTSKRPSRSPRADGDSGKSKGESSSALAAGVLAWVEMGGAGMKNNTISEDGRVFQNDNRGPKGTYGVRTACPLPMATSWDVHWDVVGTFSEAGIVTAEAPLLLEGQYGYILGKDEHSWTIGFEKPFGKPIIAFHARHNGKSRRLGWSGSCKDDVPRFRFRRAGTSLFVLLPGDEAETRAFSDLPTAEVPLFVAATTLYGKGKILLKAPSELQELPPFKKSPILAAAEANVGKPKRRSPTPKVSEAFVAALKGVGSGNWNLNLERRSRKMFKTEAGLDEAKRREVELMLGLGWGGCRVVADCFDERHMDDGIITNFPVTCKGSLGLTLSYWEAGCGGNSFGWLLEVGGPSPRVLLSNSDSDISWAGGGCKEPPAGFVQAFHRARYGD